MMGSGSASGENRARAAAEAAVSSPLLEDINLAGAHGVLVNVTAGLDLSIGEFEEVGNIVKEYASEDATVVVGTVIDPEMSNQVRVTVVATGLGRAAGAMSVRTRGELVREMTVERSLPMREASGGRLTDPGAGRALRSRAPLTASDYSVLDKPTIVRQRAVGDGLRADTGAEDLLDIPAFLRRQAD
jgi:cell division protein FtsZ